MGGVAAVIPTFNRSAALRRALESVRAQTRRPQEVIVVDDGSTDDTPGWVERDYPEVTCIRQANAGVSAARNRGVAAATCDWIAFLDSDDKWLPRKLEMQMAALAKAPEFLLCHTNEVWIRDGRRVNERKRHAKSGGWIFQRCLPLCVISPSAAVVKRSLLLDLGGFDESLPVCEDYDLWLRICSCHPVLFVPEALTVKYGGHGDQLSRRAPGMDRYRIHAIEKILSAGTLSPDDRAAAVRALLEKIEIYIEGARKRDKGEEVAACEALRAQYREECAPSHPPESF